MPVTMKLPPPQQQPAVVKQVDCPANSSPALPPPRQPQVPIPKKSKTTQKSLRTPANLLKEQGAVLLPNINILPRPQGVKKLNSWQYDLILKLNHINSAKQNEIYKLIRSTVEKYIRQEKARRNSKETLFAEKRLRKLDSLYGRYVNNPRGAAETLEIIPLKIASKIIQEIDSKYFSDTKFIEKFKKAEKAKDPNYRYRTLFEIYNLHAFTQDISTRNEHRWRQAISNILEDASLGLRVAYQEYGIVAQRFYQEKQKLLSKINSGKPHDTADYLEAYSDFRKVEEKLIKLRDEKLAKITKKIPKIFQDAVKEAIDEDRFLEKYPKLKQELSERAMSIIVGSKSEKDLVMNICKVYEENIDSFDKKQADSIVLAFKVLKKMSEECKAFGNIFFH